MMNYVWAAIMLLSVAFGGVSGRIDAVSEAMFSGASQAVELCLTLLGMLCLWSGLMRVAEGAGITAVLGKMLSPVLRIIFPGLPSNSPATQAISMNVAANILGLGNAATPFGLKAMQELQNLNPLKDTASDHMLVFVVLNSVSVQLIPTGTAVLRENYGSANPMEIMPAVWISSIASAAVGVVLAIVFCHRKRRKHLA